MAKLTVGTAAPNNSNRANRSIILPCRRSHLLLVVVTSMELRSEQYIEWSRPSGLPNGFETRYVYTCRQGESASPPMEIAVLHFSHAGKPSRQALTRVHTLRVNQRVTPVVIATVLADDTVTLFGPNTAVAPTRALPLGQAERILQAVLDEVNPVAARARLTGLLQSLDTTSTPGVKNSGLFANHELLNGVPRRLDWPDSCLTSRTLLSLREHVLVEQLGYSIKGAGAHALVLNGSGPRPEAIAVLLNETENFDADSHRFSVSPVAYGLKMAEQEGVPWLILVRGGQLRLYPARIDLGVGRKGLAETFLEIDLPQLTNETAGYLSLIFSAPALTEGGSAFQIMATSSQYAVALGGRLRDKVYEEIVPRLSLAVARQLGIHNYAMDVEGLDLAYQLTLRIFFRMLFQVYAEDRKLLPYGENEKYDRNALKTVAHDLVENPDQEFDPESCSLWDDLTQVWRVIDTGDRAWGVPAYNGGLFASDPELNEHGAIVSELSITNDVIGPCLRALLLDRSDDGEYGPIDFRSLSVREFGTIYEGLLESSLGLAEVDLTLDRDGTWLPAATGDQVEAAAGEVYFHNTSGQRKGTGSYFTPSFVVEHLLERALDPALDDHLGRVAERLAAGDQASAAEMFFDFRVADLAMGSGHFLTSAIDHIEKKMASFLEEDGHQIPGVSKEIILLGNAAIEAMGDHESAPPEGSSLLRRQIARRCIYGLDINPIAVELARVAIWIHTFVRGLPMSSLDHNLVCANSLTGIGSIDEALDALVPGRNGMATLFDAPIEDALRSSQRMLLEVALMPEVDRKETQAASRAVRKAVAEARKAKLLFDAAVLRRIGRGALVSGEDPVTISEFAAEIAAQAELGPLIPGHMPVLFPEVFLRDNGGFDVLIGNPPWEKLKVEEHQWWALRFPGLRSLPMAQRTRRIRELHAQRPDLVDEYDNDVNVSAAARKVIAAGPYPGIGSGDIDLYKAFAWRNWLLARDGAGIGLVLPRGALSGSGTEKWRREVLANGTFSDVVIGTNTRGWMFNSIHQQYTVGLIGIRRGGNDRHVHFAGSFYSHEDFLKGRTSLAVVPAKEFASWTGTAAFPLILDGASGEIFKQMRRAPTFSDTSGFEFRPYRELDATNDRGFFDTNLEKPSGPIPVFSGSSFNLYNPDFGPPYAYADIEAADHVLRKTINSASNARSAFHGLEIQGPTDLPMNRARIAFRDVCRSNDTRTTVCCLLPPGVVLVHQAPYLVRRSGDEFDEAYLLGVMSSLPFDWYARRLVELHLTFELLDQFPVPRPEDSDPQRKRVIDLAGRLAAHDERFSIWAKAIGVPVGSVTTSEERADIEAELDALVAHLYGLTRVQVTRLFATFHLGWAYQPRLTAALEHFDRLEEAV